MVGQPGRADTIPIFTAKRTPAPRSRQMTPDVYVRESIRYAREGHLEESLAFVGVLSNGDVLYSSGTYRVRVNLEQPYVVCECAWCQHELPCGHVGAVFLKMRQLETVIPHRFSEYRWYQSAS